MKLNPDCIRDILLYLEENLTIETKSGTFKDIDLRDLNNVFISQYSEEDIWYTVYNLKEIRFIEGKFGNAGEHQMMWSNITNITWNGHQFLNTIRPKTVWDATKQGASKLGLMSIHALSTIAMSVANAVITDPIVIQNIIKSMGK